MGFCDTTGAARDWKFYLWPYNAEDEQEVEWMSKVYYWIPFIPTTPAGCQLTFDIISQKNTEWEWDEWCSEDEIERKTCQSVVMTPVLLDEGSTWEIYLRVKVGVQGTSTKKDFYQFFEWDWESYNEMENWEGEEGEEWDCPPDVPGCNDFEDWEEQYYEDWNIEDENCDCEEGD